MTINPNLFFVIPFFFHWHMDSHFCYFKVIPTPIISICGKNERMTGMNITTPNQLYICIALAIMMTVIEKYSGQRDAEKQRMSSIAKFISSFRYLE